jgi:membrane-bound lytic murein transglycosylase D
VLLVAPLRVYAGDRPVLTPSDVFTDADEPATEPVEQSLWAQIEGSDASAAAASASSEELAAERRAELGYTGAIGADLPLEYYLDPLAATSIDPLQLDRVDPREFDIPIATNEMVQKWMTYFLGRGRKYYGRYLMRSTHWMPMMRAELAERGLPRDLVYLSMIESGFTTSATSYAAAAGLWQFMPATARQYGLRVDWWVDERRDPVRATRAALTYLAYLNKMFEGDWWLAWASYNGGEGRVGKEVRRHGTTDFWKLVERNALHTETQNYVPKLIAAAIIGKHPERYGFVGVPYQEPLAQESVEVPGGTGLDVIAKCAGIDDEEVLEYNPALRRWALPPDVPTWTVHLPAGRREAFEVAFAKVPPEERVTLARHVVKRKETLAGIAKKYGVESEEIARLNHLGKKSKLKVGQELVVPARPGSASLASVAPAEPTEVTAAPKSEKATTEKAASTKTVARTHTVRSGDTLSSIAARYKLSVSELKELNGLRSDRILAGQSLKVGTTTAISGSSSAKAAPASESTSKVTTYTVKRGDTLGSIAERYDCTVSEIKSWNAIRGSTIYPGQKLKIKG